MHALRGLAPPAGPSGNANPRRRRRGRLIIDAHGLRVSLNTIQRWATVTFRGVGPLRVIRHFEKAQVN